MKKSWVYEYQTVMTKVRPIGETSKETKVATNKIKNWGDNGLIRMALKGDTRYFFVEDFEIIKYLDQFSGRGVGYDDLKRKMLEKNYMPADSREIEVEIEEVIEEPSFKEAESTAKLDTNIEEQVNEIKNELQEAIKSSLVASMQEIQKNLMSQIIEKDRLLLENKTKIERLENEYADLQQDLFQTNQDKTQTEREKADLDKNFHELKEKYAILEKELAEAKNKGLFNSFKRMFSKKDKKKDTTKQN